MPFTKEKSEKNFNFKMIPLKIIDSYYKFHADFVTSLHIINNMCLFYVCKIHSVSQSIWKNLLFALIKRTYWQICRKILWLSKEYVEWMWKWNEFENSFEQIFNEFNLRRMMEFILMIKTIGICSRLWKLQKNHLQVKIPYRTSISKLDYVNPNARNTLNNNYRKTTLPRAFLVHPEADFKCPFSKQISCGIFFAC